MEYKWRFFRSGGLDQVELRSGEDLMNLDKLDRKLWVALACPLTGLNFNDKTLSYIDTDMDKRIRVPELIAAMKWTCGMLKQPDTLMQGASVLPLNAINDSSPEAQELLHSARQILATMGRADADSICIDDTADALKRFYETTFNGDGIIVEDAVADPHIRPVYTDIIACMGVDMDRCAKPGIGRNKIELFFEQAHAYVTWYKTGMDDRKIMVCGAGTASAVSSVKKVRSKVEDYFTRCRLVSYDGSAAGALNNDENRYRAMAARELSLGDEDIAALPLCRVDSGAELNLFGAANPAWSSALAELYAHAVKPLLGDKKSIVATEWQKILDAIAPYEHWQTAKCGAAVEKLGIDRLQQIVGTDAREDLLALVEKDLAEQKHGNTIIAIDKFLHYYRDLYLLCTNFVNFKSLYDDNSRAIFQAGTLYIDRRSCDLCLVVQDLAKHASLAALAGAYLIYCDCVRKATGETMTIVAVVTNGDSDNLMPGRNGQFYDYKGRDWDATVTKIVENPISLGQAFWSPYKSFVRFIEVQIAKRASSAESASTKRLETAAEATVTADKGRAQEPKKIDVGAVAALGVAFGAIGTFIAAFMGYLTGILKFGPLGVVGAVAGIVLAISVPSIILAYIKMRKRNLGPILDGNGWTINAGAKITVPLGASLTHVAKVPIGSVSNHLDPFAEKKSAWPKFIILAFLLYLAWSVLNYTGLVYQWTDGRIGTHKEWKGSIEAPVQQK